MNALLVYVSNVARTRPCSLTEGLRTLQSFELISISACQHACFAGLSAFQHARACGPRLSALQLSHVHVLADMLTREGASLSVLTRRRSRRADKRRRSRS